MGFAQRQAIPSRHSWLLAVGMPAVNARGNSLNQSEETKRGWILIEFTWSIVTIHDGEWLIVMFNGYSYWFMTFLKGAIIQVSPPCLETPREGLNVSL